MHASGLPLRDSAASLTTPRLPSAAAATSTQVDSGLEPYLGFRCVRQNPFLSPSTAGMANKKIFRSVRRAGLPR